MGKIRSHPELAKNEAPLGRISVVFQMIQLNTCPFQPYYWYQDTLQLMVVLAPG